MVMTSSPPITHIYFMPVLHLSTVGIMCYRNRWAFYSFLLLRGSQSLGDKDVEYNGLAKKYPSKFQNKVFFFFTFFLFFFEKKFFKLQTINVLELRQILRYLFSIMIYVDILIRLCFCKQKNSFIVFIGIIFYDKHQLGM